MYEPDRVKRREKKKKTPGTRWRKTNLEIIWRTLNGRCKRGIQGPTPGTARSRSRPLLSLTSGSSPLPVAGLFWSAFGFGVLNDAKVNPHLSPLVAQPSPLRFLWSTMTQKPKSPLPVSSPGIFHPSQLPSISDRLYGPYSACVMFVRVE